MGKKAGMDEQGTFLPESQEKENLPSVEEGMGNLGRARRIC